MSIIGINVTDITFDHVFALAQRLRPMEQVRLVARLAPKVEWLLEQVEPTASSLPRTPLRGLLADLGPAPSAEEIDEVQGEMWMIFTQEGL
jgi:hypothetical protein